MAIHWCFYFFFSSRRRHTRSKRDWSSDVCSSDLGIYYEEVVSTQGFSRAYSIVYHLRPPTRVKKIEPVRSWPIERVEQRSEERRVGKECRSRGGRGH